MVVPVQGNQVSVANTGKGTVHVRVDVLGYSLNDSPIKVRQAAGSRIAKGALAAETPLVVGPITGVAGLPKRAKRVTGVILKVTTRTKGPDAGSVRVYGHERAAPGTRSAPVDPTRPQASLVVSEIGADGKVVIHPSVAAKVRVEVVGWVRR